MLNPGLSLSNLIPIGITYVTVRIKSHVRTDHNAFFEHTNQLAKYIVIFNILFPAVGENAQTDSTSRNRFAF